MRNYTKTLYLINASNRNCRTAERFGVQTHYYVLPMWPVMCVTKNVLFQKKTLGWFGAYPEKQEALRDLVDTIDTRRRPCRKIATKQPITPSIPIARGWITRLMTSAYIYDCGHFEFYLHFELYFYPFSIYLQAKHDSFCAFRGRRYTLM